MIQGHDRQHLDVPLIVGGVNPLAPQPAPYLMKVVHEIEHNLFLLRQMEEITRLLWYLSPPPAFNLPPESSRRRLFGGEYPGEFVGDSFKLFGGHDYGYVIPPTAFGGDMKKIRDFTRTNAYMGFAFCAALLIGHGMIMGSWRVIKLLAFLVACNEAYSYRLSKGAKRATFQQLLDSYRRLEKGSGLGLDAGKTPLALATERYHGFQRGETRFLSGSSMLYGALAGFGLAITGVFPLNHLFTTVRNGGLSYVVSNYIFFNNLHLYIKDRDAGRNSGIAHDKHALSMIFGMCLGWSKFF